MTCHTIAETLVRSVTDQYASLPANGKPRPRTNGVPSWTVLAGFSLYRSTDETTIAHCVTIGTGLKAIPHSKLPRHGDVLHDSHAEIVARRGLKLWLYRQLQLAIEGVDEAVLARNDKGRWTLKDGWKLGLSISTLPCGDASTLSLSLSAQQRSRGPSSFPSPTPIGFESKDTAVHPSLVEAASLGLVTARPGGEEGSSRTLTTNEGALKSDPLADLLSPARRLVHRGRVSYDAYSTLRTKPGRADSPPTTSHSCSDKIALWSLLGVQGALLSSLGVGIDLKYVAVCGVKGSEGEKRKVREEIRRAIGGRLEGWQGPRGEQVKVPEVGLAETFTFEHSRENVARAYGVEEEEVVSCQESISWIEGDGTEVIANGIRQGAAWKRKNGEALGSKARSRLSKLSLLQSHLEIVTELSSTTLEGQTYYDLKHRVGSSRNVNEYQELKEAVRLGPLQGWLVSGQQWESFDSRGRLAGDSRTT